MLRTLETGASRNDARLAAVMIHGRGRAPEEMAELGASLAVDGVRYYSPEATGGSWYPGRFMDPFEVNQPALGQALAGLESLRREAGGGRLLQRPHRALRLSRKAPASPLTSCCAGPATMRRRCCSPAG